MLLNNRKHKAFVKYFDIQWVESEKKWYAWYFVTEDLKGLENALQEKEPQEASE